MKNILLGAVLVAMVGLAGAVEGGGMSPEMGLLIVGAGIGGWLLWVAKCY